MGLLAPGGRLFASTNLRKMRQGTFRKVLRNAAEGARRKVLQLKDAPEPVDYPVSIGHEVHLKAVWVTLA
jgi:23S rRNA G2069 N7-methylase RlmK/C1962 C5-methylase RlmI